MNKQSILTQMKKQPKSLKEFEELAHAYFEPGDKTYWDGINLAKSFFQTPPKGAKLRHAKSKRAKA